MKKFEIGKTYKNHLNSRYSITVEDLQGDTLLATVSEKLQRSPDVYSNWEEEFTVRCNSSYQYILFDDDIAYSSKEP